MEYKLYTDKIENFEAKIKLEGASLKKSKVRSYKMQVYLDKTRSSI